MKKAYLIIIFLFIGGAFKLAAQTGSVMLNEKSGWQKIGEMSASFKTEKETILVLGADKFKSLKLKVSDAALNITSAMVLYENGQTQELLVKGELKAGTETEAIIVKPEYEIKKVVLVYKSIENLKKAKAKVELFGLR